MRCLRCPEKYIYWIVEWLNSYINEIYSLVSERRLASVKRASSSGAAACIVLWSRTMVLKNTNNSKRITKQAAMPNNDYRRTIKFYRTSDFRVKT